MLNPFNQLIKLIATFTTVISLWTIIVLVSNTSFSSEIKYIITKIYLNQKQFIYNVKDLSILLVRDANNRFNKNDR